MSWNCGSLQAITRPNWTLATRSSSRPNSRSAHELHCRHDPITIACTNMKARKPVCASARGLYLSIVSVFGFFLASSAPHRVHHLFERFPVAENSLADKHAHEHAHGAAHEDSDHQTRPTPQAPDCFVLSIAQNAHASVVDAFAVV